MFFMNISLWIILYPFLDAILLPKIQRNCREVLAIIEPDGTDCIGVFGGSVVWQHFIWSSGYQILIIYTVQWMLKKCSDECLVIYLIEKISQCFIHWYIQLIEFFWKWKKEMCEINSSFYVIEIQHNYQGYSKVVDEKLADLEVFYS